MFDKLGKLIRQSRGCPLLYAVPLLNDALNFQRHISAPGFSECALALFICNLNIDDRNVLINLRLFFEISGYVVDGRTRLRCAASAPCRREHLIKLDGKVCPVIHFFVFSSQFACNLSFQFFQYVKRAIFAKSCTNFSFSAPRGCGGINPLMRSAVPRPKSFCAFSYFPLAISTLFVYNSNCEFMSFSGRHLRHSESMKILIKWGEKHMANIKSAKKRIRVIDKKTARNRRIKNHLKAVLKNFEAAMAEGNIEVAAEKLHLAEKKLMQAAAKGTISKHAASRKVSRLTKRFNTAKAAK